MPNESMLSIRESWKNLKGFLLRSPSQCTICLSSICKPAKLTCGHHFCENCIEEYWRVESQRNHVICPLCRAHITDITFIEEEPSENNEFRKEFDANHKNTQYEFSDGSVLFMKIGLVFPIVYYTMQYLKVPFFGLLHSFRFKFMFINILDEFNIN